MTNFYGQQDPGSATNQFNAFVFAWQRLMSRVRTLDLVTVQSVSNSGGLSPSGTVTVIPLVNQMTGNRLAVSHGPIYNVPYLRIQGGTNAVILDPAVGDIGLCGFCSRDISSVKKAAAQAIAASTTLLAQNPTEPGLTPGSYRMFDWADGVYIGACLNGTPVQYVQFTSSGINVVSPGTITLEAPTVAVQGNLTVSGSTVGTGNGTFGGIDMDTHKHTGVTTGSGTSGGPTG
jgi:hypothetical protein